MNSIITKTLAISASSIVALGMTAGVALAAPKAATKDDSLESAATPAEQTAITNARGGNCGSDCVVVLRHLGDRLTTERVSHLNDLKNSIDKMQKLSTGQIAGFDATITTNINAMNTLKSKIDGETNISALMDDLNSIFQDYRIYSLVTPQIKIEANADRMDVVNQNFTDLATKLETAITAMPAGADKEQAQALLNDMKAKVADAEANADGAAGEVVNLSPDHGNDAIHQANLNAVADAKTKIHTVATDLKAAHADVKQIETLLHMKNSTPKHATVPHGKKGHVINKMTPPLHASGRIPTTFGIRAMTP